MRTIYFISLYIPTVIINLPESPLCLFRDWLGQAEACETIRYAAAMGLSTVVGEGLPDGRTVLLHDVSNAGFAFITDARSSKGVAMAHTPATALTFYWGPLERQIRIRDEVNQAPATTADRIFQKLPRRRQFTSRASEQSQPIDSRTTLDERLQAVEALF